MTTCIDCSIPTDQKRGFAGLLICDQCWLRRCGTPPQPSAAERLEYLERCFKRWRQERA